MPVLRTENAGEDYESILNPRYTNHTYDDALGMYHAQFRFFDANTRSFSQEDPIKDDLNWYGYCSGNPISNIDPIGCAAITVPPEISNYLNAISVDPITFGLGITFGVVAFPFYYAIVNDIDIVPPLADLEMYLKVFSTPLPEQWENIESFHASGGLLAILSQYFTKAGECGDGASQGKTVDDLLGDATPGRETKGKSTQWEKPGGEQQANEDFDSLNPTGVRQIPSGRVGTLSDGRGVNVRTDSSDGRPTLEVQNPNGTKIKIRYYE